MPYEYIISIVLSSIFLLIFIIFLISYGRSENNKLKLYDELEKMYADENLVKMDYDFAVYDEETARRISDMQKSDGQIVMEDIINLGAAAADEAVFGTVDKDGLDEITGNYTP